MKFFVLLLPTLLQIALIVALHSQTIAAPPLTPEQRDAEIRELRSELKRITARLDTLESEGHQFVPRGGLTAGNTGAPGSLVSGWGPDLVRTKNHATAAIHVKF